MTKRQLNKDEMALCAKVLTAKQEESEYIEYQLQYHDLMLKTGLELNYKRVLREYKHQKSEYEKDLVSVKETISTLQKQMREGVEIIEETAEKEVKD